MRFVVNFDTPEDRVAFQELMLEFDVKWNSNTNPQKKYNWMDSHRSLKVISRDEHDFALRREKKADFSYKNGSGAKIQYNYPKDKIKILNKMGLSTVQHKISERYQI